MRPRASPPQALHLDPPQWQSEQQVEFVERFVARKDSGHFQQQQSHRSGKLWMRVDAGCASSSEADPVSALGDLIPDILRMAADRGRPKERGGQWNGCS